MSNPRLPPGCPAPRRISMDLSCSNPECGNTWEVDGISELGGCFVEHEGDDVCPECGGEGV